MKRFISKVKKTCKDFFTNKSAFSLVELIVVIAIMAVMAAVLAPALLGYVEKSRMQKDDSAMDEVVNAVQLSLADQSIYDEVLEHSVWDNVSCYIDKKDESQFSDCKVQLKAANGDKKEQYMFGDEARLLDETVYYAAGNMRGLTITFSPNESGDTYDFSKGILNKFVGRKTGLLSENPELYNRLRSVIGDKLDTTSQTYRNSDYTIFIRVGSTGGSEAVMQDAIQVWGQFNGTNLAEKDHKYELSSGRVVGTAGANDATNNQTNNENTDINFSEEHQLLNLSGIIPEGGVYTVYSTKEVLYAGDPFPETLGGRDSFVYGDYEYRYNTTWQQIIGSWDTPHSNQNGWGVRIVDRSKSEYGPILQSIQGKAINATTYTFYGCTKLLIAPEIPDTVVTMSGMFRGCTQLTTAPIIPSGMQNKPSWSTYDSLYEVFRSCDNLKTYAGSTDADGDFSNYVIPNVQSLDTMFFCCDSITISPIIPNGVTNISNFFGQSESLNTITGSIPSSVTKMGAAFQSCKKLTGTIIIDANPTSYSNCFGLSGDKGRAITFKGTSSMLQELAQTCRNTYATIVDQDGNVLN